MLQPLVRNWLVGHRRSNPLQLPGKVVVVGIGPLTKNELQATLSVRKIKAADPPDASTDVRAWCSITASIFDKAYSSGSDWKDGVVPIGMEVIVSDLQGVELGF